MVTLYETYYNREVEIHQKIVNNKYVTNYFMNMNRRKNLIMCTNCGGYGHVYRTCNHPTISYGFICFKLELINDKYEPMYLMVQRKDSLSYVEFMRGKYDLENRTYIMRLFSHMTEDERYRIKSKDFNNLWNDMWCKTEEETNKNFNREYTEAYEKFNIIKNGYYIRSNNNDVIHANLEYFLNNTVCEYNETEWGFPKGRRNVNEHDINCALREFKEETGFTIKNIHICSEMKPLEEIFSGTNKKRYKHVYYIARFNGDEHKDSYPSCREIKDVKWFTYEEAQNHIRDINIERKELLKRLNQIIVKNL